MNAAELLLCKFLLCLIPISMSAAQQPETPGLRPIDAGYEDASTNRTSQLLPRADQQNPSGFRQVYQLTKPSGEVVYVRIDGGIYAEFPRSVYVGNAATIPPGTRFVIGKPPVSQDSDQPAADSFNRVDLAADMRPDSNESARLQQRVNVGTPSIAGNELYRRLRLTELLFSLTKDR